MHCKDKCRFYHITYLDSSGIFRLWASTFTRPETQYSIQCLHFVWAHHRRAQIAAFTEIDFIFLPVKPNSVSTFNMFQQVLQEHCAPFPGTALLTFMSMFHLLWLAVDTKACHRLFYTFLPFLCYEWDKQENNNWKVQLFACGFSCDSLLGNAAAVLWLW